MRQSVKSREQKMCFKIAFLKKEVCLRETKKEKLKRGEKVAF